MGLFEKLIKKKRTPKTVALIAAAGSGSRMDGSVPDKLFYKINGKEVIARTLAAFEKAETIDAVVVVTRGDLVGDVYALAKEIGISKLASVTRGADSRAESVVCGLKDIPADAEFITVADGARPFVSPFVIDEVSRAAYKSGAAAACAEVTDTIKMLDASAAISKTLDRSRLVAMQTPQCFRLSDYKKAVEAAAGSLRDLTDDCAVMEKAGVKVTPVFSDRLNIKITRPEDLVIAEAIAAARDEGEKE